MNWLNQWDQNLIKFIKERLIIPPPKHIQNDRNLENKYDPSQPWKHQGQKGEPVIVEYLYGLSKDEQSAGTNKKCCVLIIIRIVNKGNV